MNHKAHAATAMLARMMIGVQQTGSDELAMDDIVQEDGRVSASLILLPSGDTYRIAVEWDGEASP